ncbi:unnamed protein product [Ranitomeya imitator]|uniref:Opticin n=1 Tax=Ranitomeya imitator TaxID=111125 RepID=A0ABN9M435_9NEOB|nr:unnamed protein product [Ranitomeya imitator]
MAATDVRGLPGFDKMRAEPPMEQKEPLALHQSTACHHYNTEPHSTATAAGFDLVAGKVALYFDGLLGSYFFTSVITKLFFHLSDKLQKIDLTSNIISEIDEDAFMSLSQLNELSLLDNRIRQLPELPNSLNFIDVSKNRLGRKGIKQEAFKDLKDLHILYLNDNNLDHIPLPLPDSLQALHLQDNNIQEMHEDTFCKMKDLSYARRALEDIRLDGNPINLSRTPQAFMCLPRIPVGRLV